MASIKDHTGERYGKLTVDAFAYRRDSNTYWRCICDCGALKVTRYTELASGRVQSCGCEKVKQPVLTEPKVKKGLWDNIRRMEAEMMAKWGPVDKDKFTDHWMEISSWVR